MMKNLYIQLSYLTDQIKITAQYFTKFINIELYESIKRQVCR